MLKDKVLLVMNPKGKRMIPIKKQQKQKNKALKIKKLKKIFKYKIIDDEEYSFC